MIVTGASNMTPLVIDSEGPCDPHCKIFLGVLFEIYTAL